MMLLGKVILTGMAVTAEGEVPWNDTVSAPSISAAICLSESNLRLAARDVTAHFTSISAQALEPAEPIVIEGKKA